MNDFYLILLIIGILLVLTVVLYFILNGLIKQINDTAKSSFVLKMQEYEDIINEREEKLKELENNKEENESFDESDDTKSSDQKVIIETKEVEYKVEDLLKKAKEIDDKFEIDEQKIIENFLNNKIEQENKELYIELVNMYRSLSNMNDNKLLKKVLINDVLNQVSDKMKDIILKYFGHKKYILLVKLMDILEFEIKKNDPIVYIMVGKKNINYNYLSKRIRTLYNSRIYKGIKIIYHNKIYDYSLE